RRTRFIARRGADEGEVLDAGDVVRVRAVEVAAGALLGVERDQQALRDGFLGEALPLLFRAVAPDDAVGLRELGHLAHPGLEMRVGRKSVPALRCRAHASRFSLVARIAVGWGRSARLAPAREKAPV